MFMLYGCENLSINWHVICNYIHMEFSWCIIADDFTGAGDSAIQFKTIGYSVFHGLKGWETLNIDPYNVLVVSTESRFMDPENSYTKVFSTVKICKRYHIKCFFKKIDSTIRGNVADEIAAVMDAAGYDCALIAPAAPRNGRTVVDGHCLVEGHPVGSGAGGDDLFTPVTDSYIPALFEARFPDAVGHIDLSVRRRGKKAFRDELSRLRRDGKKVIISDAESIDDLRVAATAKDDASVLMAGASGLAEAMTSESKRFHGEHRLPETKQEEMLFLVGSVNDTSRRQSAYLRMVKDIDFLTVDIASFLRDEEAEMKHLMTFFSQFKGNRPVLIETLFTAETQDVVTELSVSLGLGEKVLGGKVSLFLGRLVTELFRLRRFRLLFATGGDTAARVVESLGIKGIELSAEILPGIPLGLFNCELSGDDPVCLVSKAGGFGPEDAMEQVFDFLKVNTEKQGAFL